MALPLKSQHSWVESIKCSSLKCEWVIHFALLKDIHLPAKTSVARALGITYQNRAQSAPTSHADDELKTGYRLLTHIGYVVGIIVREAKVVGCEKKFKSNITFYLKHSAVSAVSIPVTAEL